jgi:pyridoxal phosphate enzyme (YggS family)
MSEIADNLAAVRERIARAATSAGRDPGEIKLIAVSKTKPAEAVREAYLAGQRAFGENYAQELATKAAELADLPDIEWHFIGHLQSNKAKLIVRAAKVVHTIDTVSLARELGKRATQADTPPIAVLVEVNVGGEAQKFGVAPSDLAEVIQGIKAEPALALRGLMTIPPEGNARAVFDTLATLRSLHGGKALLPELSMGMSADLEDAVVAGSTMVRVGTAIFGAR